MEDIGLLLPPAAGAPMLLALVGGGGKTSLMFALARAAAGLGMRVITSTTTHIRPPSPEQSPVLLLAGEHSPEHVCRLLRAGLKRHAHVTLGGAHAPESGKISGITARILQRIIEEKTADLILVEADGAKGMPLKFPADHEPCLPPQADLCLAVLGMDGMALPLRQGLFRAEAAAAAIGPFNPDLQPEPDLAARLALHEKGLLRLCPPGMNTAVVCNKADLPGAMAAAGAIRAAALKLYPERKARWYASSAREGWAVELAGR